MSAYHWEARRRQHVLDRRSNDEKARENTVQPPVVSSKQVKIAVELNKRIPADKKCKHCSQGTYHPPATTYDDDYSAKMQSRYNSVQYNQQW